MPTHVETVLAWGNRHDLEVTELKIKDPAVKRNYKDFFAQCQGFSFNEALQICTTRDKCKFFAVTYQGDTVGIMVYTSKYRAAAHDLSPSDLEMSSDTGDIRLMCARGGVNGGGEFLVLLAMAMAKHGLFVQVGLTLEEDAASELFTSEPIFHDQAADVIYQHLGFKRVHPVRKNGIYFHRAPVRRDELKNYLDDLDRRIVDSRINAQQAAELDSKQQAFDHMLDNLDDLLAEVKISKDALPVVESVLPPVDQELLLNFDPFPGAGPSILLDEQGSQLLDTNIPLQDIQLRPDSKQLPDLVPPHFEDLKLPAEYKLDDMDPVYGLNNPLVPDNFDDVKVPLEYKVDPDMDPLVPDNFDDIELPDDDFPLPEEKDSVDNLIDHFMGLRVLRKNRYGHHLTNIVVPRGREQDRHQCPHCPVSIKHRQNLRRHIRTHDRNRNKPYQCGLCNYATDRRADLETHERRRHRRERRYQCNHCERTHFTLSDKYGHMRDVHDVDRPH